MDDDALSSISSTREDDATRRARHAVESLLDNESLTADLEDEPAQALLAWGTQRARQIALDSAGMSDLEAEEAIAPRLRALRQMLRLINHWAAAQTDTPPAEILEQVVNHASVIYGATFSLPTPESRALFLQNWVAPAQTPLVFIETLRAWVEASVGAT